MVLGVEVEQKSSPSLVCVYVCWLKMNAETNWQGHFLSDIRQESTHYIYKQVNAICYHTPNVTHTHEARTRRN